MAKNTNTKNPVTLEDLMTAINGLTETVKGINTRLTALEEAPKTKSSTPKSTKTRQTKSDDNFDKAGYTKACKELKVWSEKMNRGFSKIGAKSNPDGNIVVRYMNGELTKAQAKAEIAKHYPDLYK